MSVLARNLYLLNLGRFLLPRIESAACIHTTVQLDKNWNRDNIGPRKFMQYNNVIFEPQTPDEERRPAYICNMKKNIKYSPFKMYWVACLVRGLTVDEALRQLSVCPKKGATYARDTILEAQEMAIKHHNVEFQSNLWVAESFSSKGQVIKGMRRHAFRRAGHVQYMYSHYFVRLEEGTPPKDYYNKTVTPEQQLDLWLENMRKRKVDL